MFYETFIGLRHLRPKKRGAFISVITLLAIAGVAVGVGALIIVMAVMNGFEKDLTEKILGAHAHLLILAAGDEKKFEHHQIMDRLRSLEGIEASSPFIQTQAILVNRGRTLGVILKGIDPLLERGVTDIQKKVISGSDKLKTDEEILIGSELASYLGAGVGSSIMVVSPKMIPASLGIGMLPHIVPFKVGGIFKSGMYEYDSSLALLNLRAAQRLLGLGDRVDGVAVKIGDIYEAPLIKGNIEPLFDYHYTVRTWMEVNRNLFSALRLEKAAMFIILILIVFVAGLSIANTLTMIVMHKRKEIGILLGLGATRWGIMRIFIFEGVLIGFIGTLAGLFFGFLGCGILSRFEFVKLPQDIYYIDYLPVNIEIGDIFLVTLCAITVAVLATIYPAISASRLDPVEIMRYE